MDQEGVGAMELGHEPALGPNVFQRPPTRSNRGGRMSKQRQKGTLLETLAVLFLQARLGDDRIMRMPLSGAKDRGDVAGIRTLLGEKVCIEVKNHARMDLGTWLREAEVERGNADAQVAVVVHKRVGKGQAKDQLVTMTLESFAVLLGGRRESEDPPPNPHPFRPDAIERIINRRLT